MGRLFRNGEENVRAKLTDGTVRAIRKLHEEGWGLKRLARRFEVTTGCIRPVVRRETWKHVHESPDI
jgi:hypothetical protein